MGNNVTATPDPLTSAGGTPFTCTTPLRGRSIALLLLLLTLPPLGDNAMNDKF